MADIASRPAFAPRLPWRAITVAFLIGALLLAAAIAYFGSRPARVAPPFGLADNGLIAYSADGDIWTADPLTGVTNAIVTGKDDDVAPVYSPDGTKIAFVRKASIDGSLGEEIVVVSADGSNPIVVSRQPAARATTHLEWAPDSRSLLTGLPDFSEVLMLDATVLAEPRIVARDADPNLRPFRPPNGDSILVHRKPNGGSAIVRVDLETGEELTLATSEADDLGSARWSPDGSQVVYTAVPPDDEESRRLFLVNADGTGARQVTSAPGTWWDIDASWSPDGDRIAFLRYQRIAADTWDVRPLGIYTVADGSVVDAGPVPREVRGAHPSTGDQFVTPGEGWWFDWAPDGTSLIAFPSEGTGHPILIDATSGDWAPLDAAVTPVGASQVWQRTAP